MMANGLMTFAGTGITGAVMTNNSGVLTIGADGGVAPDNRDTTQLLNAGARFATSFAHFTNYNAPLAAAAGAVVASVALANGALTILAQPDVPRPLNVRVSPGTLAISAGLATLIYDANDATRVTDSLSLVTAVSTLLTQVTSRGVVKLVSATISALAGGASPLVQVDTTTELALPVGKNFQNFAVQKENLAGADETVGTVGATRGAIAPSTAANGTRNFSFGYTFVLPT